MARSIAEIKRGMEEAFVNDATLREKYGLKEGDTFGGSFSTVSLESILLYIVAACCHMVETLMDWHKEEVNERIGRAVVASVPWYHKMARAFQLGDALTLDEQTMGYGYATVDESKQVVKYAAVRDRGTSVEILVSGEKDGLPDRLSDDVLTAFKEYMNRVKIAGVVLGISSREADRVTVTMRVTVDRLVIGADGRRISDGTRPVEDAIRNYLKGIVYGGTFNKTKLTDAVQAVEGVTDVELGECRAKAADAAAYTAIGGNNYRAVGGSLRAEGLENSITYVA